MTAPLLLASQPPPVVAPQLATNRIDRVGRRSAIVDARGVLAQHRAGLEARRDRDLLSEKLLLHIDGTGDAQWADIFQGTKVEIPRLVSEYRQSENLLRAVVDNAVAHHITMQLMYLAGSSPDRRSRDKALMDTLWANDLADTQDLNGLFADALYTAMPMGFCPVHRYWRDDTNDQYEPVGYGGAGQGPVPGMLDCWLGNPWDHVFGRASRRGSVPWSSYGRVLSADLVRQTFDHIPAARGLVGTDKIGSASMFQNIARSWRMTGLGVHGMGVLRDPRGDQQYGDEELLILLCRETLPGILTDYPQGRLQIIAVPECADLRTADPSKAVELYDNALPGMDYSWSLCYSHHRGDDIHGKPWVEDLDEHQQRLNIALSNGWEYLLKGKDAPIVAPAGALGEDMMDVGGYQVIETEPSVGNWRPRALDWPAYIQQGFEKKAAECRNAIYTLGGYQAVSRGESLGSRTAAKTVIALQSADSSIHGPVNLRFRRFACDFMRGCWKQMKFYGTVPQVISIVGPEYEYLAEPWVDSTKLSDRPPNFKLVNAFGASPEARAQEILQLMTLRGADGEVFLSTRTARRMYPGQMLLDRDADPKAVQRNRAKSIAVAIVSMTAKFRQQTGMQEDGMGHPWVMQAGQRIFGAIETAHPMLRDDDLQSHIDALSEITQDETCDGIARIAAQMRQDRYFQWQASFAATPGMPAPGGAKPGAPTPVRPGRHDARAVEAERQGGQPSEVESEDDAPPIAAARG